MLEGLKLRIKQGQVASQERRIAESERGLVEARAKLKELREDVREEQAKVDEVRAAEAAAEKVRADLRALRAGRRSRSGSTLLGHVKAAARRKDEKAARAVLSAANLPTGPRGATALRLFRDAERVLRKAGLKDAADEARDCAEAAERAARKEAA